MSARAENWVLQLCEQQKDLRPVDCHVLQLLAIRHDHDYSIAWPSVERMALESHYTPRAIYKALDRLCRLGLVHRSFGELPRRSRRDRVKLGNRYAFPGLDEIIEDEGPRLLGGRRRDGVHEPGSSEPEDVEMNLEPSPDERRKAVEMNRADERSVTARDGADEPETHVTPEQDVSPDEETGQKPGSGACARADGPTWGHPRLVGQPCPKPVPKPTRYSQLLDLIREADPLLVVGGSRVRNEQSVNDSPAPVETIAEAYVALMRGAWQDQLVRKMGSLHAVVENLGGYLIAKGDGFPAVVSRNGHGPPPRRHRRYVGDEHIGPIGVVIDADGTVRQQR